VSAHGNIFDQVRKFFHGVVFSRQILRSQQTRKVLLSNLTDEEEWHEVGSRHARTRRSQLSLADSCVRLVSGCQLSQWLRMSWSSSRRQRWGHDPAMRCSARGAVPSRGAAASARVTPRTWRDVHARVHCRQSRRPSPAGAGPSPAQGPAPANCARHRVQRRPLIQGGVGKLAGHRCARARICPVTAPRWRY
jgi:hypothetical protein